MRLSQFLSILSPLVFVCSAISFLSASETSETKPRTMPPTASVLAALQAEVNHDAEARSKSLAKALAESPDDPNAHWHSGHIWIGNTWMTVQDSEAIAANDQRLMVYRQLRDSNPETVESQIALARWCRKENLAVQEQLHWARVFELSPDHEEARIRLGLLKFRGQYVTRQQLESLKQKMELADQALKKWKPLAEKCRKAFMHRDPTAQESAIEELQSVDDWQAIPAFEEYLAPVNPAAELAVVNMLGRIEHQLATDFLIRHAVLSEHSRVRNAAAQALRQRSFFAFIPTLVGALKTPIEYSYYADTFQTEGPSQILEVKPAAYMAEMVTVEARVQGGPIDVRYDPVLNHGAKVQRSRAASSINIESVLRNERIYDVLVTTTNQELPREPQAWWEWWQKYNELQTYDELGKKPLVSLTSRNPKRIRYALKTSSCFLPGTKVWLDIGQVPIEQVRIGDRVLSQDPETGELDYRFVIGTTIRPPSPTIRIGLPKEEIAATLGHPLWVVGQGWRMAKEITVGNYLHGVGGGVPVEYVEKGPDSQAYNLVVADFSTYFIGGHRILVHDNTARKPTQALIPGFSPRPETE